MSLFLGGHTIWKVKLHDISLTKFWFSLTKCNCKKRGTLLGAYHRKWQEQPIQKTFPDIHPSLTFPAFPWPIYFALTFPRSVATLYFLCSLSLKINLWGLQTLELVLTHGKLLSCLKQSTWCVKSSNLRLGVLYEFVWNNKGESKSYNSGLSKYTLTVQTSIRYLIRILRRIR